ncbi:calcium-transporting ATPase 3, endoplasmic reticulum-type [Oryza glaberrima]|uniref:calcium-transporting ATPase 3, endoplasmic reticulum-type n=1 Tax=Oryza glaberrima TaxID=4538 RepID=UPI00224C1670|nr:calcium-transporting ATPase 3, endoplasmic reticulum-type [Oryza glaberrima]
MEDAYAKSVAEVLAAFGVDPTKGLSDEQVEQHARLYGKNELPQEESTPFWKLVLKQFDDLLVKILIAAAVISFLLARMNGETGLAAFLEPSVIFLILAANAAVGVITETNAEKALEELRAYQADVATVLRNGCFSILPATELVPGDIVEVGVGCKVPADMRTIEMLSHQLRVDQAILTGESCSVAKELESTSTMNAVYQDKTNILFSGTVVVAGRARAVVIGVGSNTAMGSIRDAMLRTEDEATPLKKKLDEFGTFLAKVIAGICILVWVVNIGHFRDPSHGGFLRGAIHYFKVAVALAVAAIPEGLPAVVTTCLALGTKRMARLNAIVRSLPSVETLGCTTVICSDKTGTLTTNMMSVSKVCVVRSVHQRPITDEYSISGTTFAPDGFIYDAGGLQLEFPPQSPCLLHIAMCSALCNESTLQYNPDKKCYEKIGESTEVALRVLVEKVGLPGFDSMPSALNMLTKHERASYCNRYWENQFRKISVLEFSRDRKMMSVLCSRKQQEIMFSKGAPESVMARCTHILCNDDGSSVPLTMDIRNELEARFQSFAGKDTLRCLALALKRMPEGQQSLSYNDEANLTFIGLVGMLDPPREEVRNAIHSCMSAGIRVIVVTGDNKSTAESLCRQIGAFEHLEDFTGYSYTASEFEGLPPLEKANALQRMVLFSRVEPSHKRMLVEALQLHNEVVAMTGDGVNDAPALKKADIGIAMGSGTAVAKSASDMVLADDNFATIVAAVSEGRAIYNNTKQFIRYMISSNIGEVVCIFVAAVLGMPDTLVPVQLLWVNLVTDGLPATAIGFNKPDSNIMTVKPRKVNEAVVNGWLFFRYLIIGAYVGLATIAGFVWWFVYSEDGPRLPYSELVNFDSCSTRQTSYPCSIFEDRHPSTVSMTVLVVVEMFNALNNLSENQSLLAIHPWSNLWLVGSIVLTMLLHISVLYIEPLSALFSVSPLSWAEWKVVLYLSFPVILIDEVLKFFSRSSRGRRFPLRLRRREILPKESRDN